MLLNLNKDNIQGFNQQFVAQHELRPVGQNRVQEQAQQNHLQGQVDYQQPTAQEAQYPMPVSQQQLNNPRLQAVAPQQVDTLLMGQVGHNSTGLLENSGSAKRLGGTSPMIHHSTTPHLQGNDKAEVAVRCSAQNSATSQDTTMSSLHGEGRKPCGALNEKPAMPTTRTISEHQ